MAKNDDSAPDLKILGDQITLQPSGYIKPSQPRDDEKEEALMKHMARFRQEPLQYVTSAHRPVFPLVSASMSIQEQD